MGSRRSGKSKILELIINELLEKGVDKNHIISINFEDLSFEDIDEIKKNIKLYKQLNKIKNLIPDGNKYETIKIIIDEIMNDNVDFNSMNPDKYLEMIDKYMAEGKKFYMFNEDITYEDYKKNHK